MFKRSIPGTLLIIFSIFNLIVGIPYVIVVFSGGLESTKTQIILGVYAFVLLLLAYTFFFTASGSAVLDFISFGELEIATALFKHRMLYAKNGLALRNGLMADLDEEEIAIMNAIFKQRKTNMDKHFPGLAKLREGSPTLGKLRRKLAQGGKEAEAATRLTGI